MDVELFIVGALVHQGQLKPVVALRRGDGQRLNVVDIGQNEQPGGHGGILDVHPGVAVVHIDIGPVHHWNALQHQVEAPGGIRFPCPVVELIGDVVLLVLQVQGAVGLVKPVLGQLLLGDVVRGYLCRHGVEHRLHHVGGNLRTYITVPVGPDQKAAGIP